jgi:hypothetical protein
MPPRARSPCAAADPAGACPDRASSTPFGDKRRSLPAYDVATARQFLTMTGELPGSKRGLEIVLAEHRRALATSSPPPRSPPCSSPAGPRSRRAPETAAEGITTAPLDRPNKPRLEAGP